jgi:hypothetical protein
MDGGHLGENQYPVGGEPMAVGYSVTHQYLSGGKPSVS